MSDLVVQKANNENKAALPVFEELAKRFDGVRQRAFDLFEKRGQECGHALEDWLEAEREILGAPAAEFKEKDNAYQMLITLPGFDPKDVQVTATPDEIIVHASSNQESSSKGKELLWAELRSSDLYKRFLTPTPIDAEKTVAKLENGILRVTAPKALASQEKAIAAKVV